ncbi:hypothetical protein ACFWBN_14645 [Streptomyces sp. NPDC059989]|uniref:hypothetical protein n=1 Tax=Streptomyces sp. NPDC059989 TaxID=3347026 RepID=UPI00367F9CFA
MKRTAMAAALVLPALLLTGCGAGDGPPPLADQQGKSFVDASMAAKSAGYELRLDTGAGSRKHSSLDYLTARNPTRGPSAGTPPSEQRETLLGLLPLLGAVREVA